MHADPCSEGVSWQLLSEAKHSSSHKNFAGRCSLENLYATMARKEIASSGKNPAEGAWILKLTSMVGLDGKAMKLVQKRPSEGASIVK